MKSIYKERLKKDQILTVPNCLSFARILMIPLIIVLYCVFEEPLWSAGVIVFSALTDIIDGKIARHFNMVSDFGKFLDPVADKLTLAAMMFCLVASYPLMIGLIVLMGIKESYQFFAGLNLLKKENKMNSALWFGKMNTAVLYLVMLHLFIFPGISDSLSVILILICAVAMVISMIGYAISYRSERTKNKVDENTGLS